jgi:hypothetical protein
MEENLSWADKTAEDFGRMRRLPAQVSYLPPLGPTHTMFVVQRGPTTWRSGPLGQGTLAGIAHGDDEAGQRTSEVNQMNRRHWKPFVIVGAAIVVIAVVATILLVQEQSPSGKIVKLEGNTVTLAKEGGQTQVVKLNSVEGLTVGTTVEVEGYSPETMTGERAQVIQP